MEADINQLYDRLNSAEVYADREIIEQRIYYASEARKALDQQTAEFQHAVNEYEAQTRNAATKHAEEAAMHAECHYSAELRSARAIADQQGK